MKWSSKEKEILVKLWPTASFQEIFKALPNRTIKAIRAQAFSLGVQSQINRSMLGNLEKLLEDTFETYYWIGYILADGCLFDNTIILNASEKDKSQLEIFAKFINVKIRLTNKAKISYINGKEYNTSNMYVASIRNPKVFSQIVSKFGFQKDKTRNPLKLSQLANVPDDLFLALFLGFADGDGTIREFTPKIKKGSRYSLRIMCHQGQLSFLKYCEERIKNIYNWTPAKKNHPFINSKLNPRGYAEISFDNIITKELKQKAIELKLPILERKWSIIN